MTATPQDFEKQLKKYADLLIHVGLNVQAGQRVMIRAPLEAAPLVRLATRSAYEAGSELVSVLWSDDQLALTRFQYAPRDSFSVYPEWQAHAFIEGAKRGDAFLSIHATDPDLLKGQDPDLVAEAQQTAQKHLAEYYAHSMRDAMPWCVASVPIPAWAAKVFPEDDPQTQMDKLWGAIFSVTRLDQADPVEAWRKHVSQLKNRSDYLNAKQYTALKYTGPGTDLTLGLPENHIWKSGQSVSQAGTVFTANMPTEEVFTMGHREKAEGVVSSSKPLNYGGTLIDEFSLTFENGHITHATAKTGEDTLRKLLDTDDGARRIGEIALVPHSSPISQSGLLFYNTLFDENAASHLAVGRAYRFSLEGGKTMDDETFNAAGGNTSLVHVDFMIGNGDLDIDGLTADGHTEAVMRGGEWAF